MPCDKEQKHHCEQLVLREPLPSLLCPHQRADEVVFSVHALLFEHPPKVVAEGLHVGTSTSSRYSVVAFPDTAASDHSRKLFLSSAGTPSNSAMTIMGSGKAKSSIRSISPLSSTASSSESAIVWMRGRIRSIRRGVNALETRALRRS